jgi:hypothetical protein
MNVRRHYFATGGSALSCGAFEAKPGYLIVILPFRAMASLCCGPARARPRERMLGCVQGIAREMGD